jgi:peptidoglycan hydrolase FlgJ
MNLVPSIFSAGSEAAKSQSAVGKETAKHTQDDKLQKAFQTFVAGTFYKQMLKSLRKMEKKPAYFYGGQAEEIFRGQMDQEVAEKMAKRQGDALSGSMYRAFAQRMWPDLAKAVAKQNPSVTAQPAQN